MKSVVKSQSAFFLGSLLSLMLCSCKAEVGNSASSKPFNPPSSSSVGGTSSVGGDTAQTYTVLPPAVIVGRVKPTEVARVEPQEETYRGLAD